MSDEAWRAYNDAVQDHELACRAYDEAERALADADQARFKAKYLRDEARRKLIGGGHERSC